MRRQGERGDQGEAYKGSDTSKEEAEANGGISARVIREALGGIVATGRVVA